jgi:hypothetical protein
MRGRSALFLGLGILAAGGSARAAGVPVDVAVVMAVDVSGSVDPVEAREQRDGYVEAMIDPIVVRAIQANMLGRIAVAYIEWSGSGDQRTLIGWTLIDGPESAHRFSAALAEQPMSSGMWTSISGAIDGAAMLFDSLGYEAQRRVIDISGDGPNNRGRPVEEARDDAVAKGIVINGVPIYNDRPQPWTIPTPVQLGLDRYYRDHVIGGPGAFTVPARSFEDFKTAILDKIVREIADTPAPPDRRRADR